MTNQFESLAFWEKIAQLTKEKKCLKPLVKWCLMIMTTEEAEEELHPIVYQRLKELHKSI